MYTPPFPLSTLALPLALVAVIGCVNRQYYPAPVPLERPNPVRGLDGRSVKAEAQVNPEIEGGGGVPSCTRAYRTGLATGPSLAERAPHFCVRAERASFLVFDISRLPGNQADLLLTPVGSWNSKRGDHQLIVRRLPSVPTVSSLQEGAMVGNTRVPSMCSVTLGNAVPPEQVITHHLNKLGGVSILGWFGCAAAAHGMCQGMPGDANPRNCWRFLAQRYGNMPLIPSPHSSNKVDVTAFVESARREGLDTIVLWIDMLGGRAFASDASYVWYGTASPYPPRLVARANGSGPSAVPTGCGKDTDCKGQRICENGVCRKP